MHPAAFKKKLRRDLKAQEREDLVWGNKLERGEEFRSISDLKVWSESESVMTAGRKKKIKITEQRQVKHMDSAVDLQGSYQGLTLSKSALSSE